MATPFSSPSPSRLFSPTPKSPSASSEKQGSKPLENPFLARGAPVVRTNKDDNSNSGLGFTPRSPSALAVVPANELRNRKGHLSTKAEPPKTSVYLHPGGDFGSASNFIKENAISGSYDLQSTTVGSTDGDGSWVLIYGLSNFRQYQAVVDKFGTYGRILKRKKPSSLFDDNFSSHQNWVALQYESRLEAEKALCHDHFQLERGVFCGVKRLSNDDPILLYHGVQDDASRAEDSAFIPVEDNANDSSDGPKDNGERVKSVCERFFRWCLSIE